MTTETVKVVAVDLQALDFIEEMGREIRAVQPSYEEMKAREAADSASGIVGKSLSYRCRCYLCTPPEAKELKS